MAASTQSGGFLLRHGVLERAIAAACGIALSATPLAVLAQSAPEPAASATETAVLEEVVVTAEKRAGSAQRTAAPIEVLSGDDVAMVTRAQDLTKLVPGLQIGATGQANQVYIRGVGDQSTNLRAGSGVAMNLDGVYLANGANVTTNMFDVARVEVLKGPQGTLYGRNASGGTINFVTNAPTLGKFAGSAALTIGDYSLVNAEAALNLSLGATTALRIAGQSISRDGYLSNGGDDQKTHSGRIKFLWQPSDAVSLLLTAEASHIGGQGSGAVALPHTSGDPWRQNTQAPFPFAFQFNAGTAPYVAPTDASVVTNIRGVSAELNAKFGVGTLTVLGAYRTQKSDTITYGTNFRFSELYDGKQKSLEARLAGDTGPASWIVGAYYYSQPYFSELDPTQGTTVLAVQFDQNIKATAGFGQVTFKVADKARLIAGLRETRETTDATFQTGSGALPLIPFVPAGRPTPVSLSANNFNWKAGFEYDAAERSLLYLTASTGFKAGGFGETAACGPHRYNPETLTAYEAGSKNRFLGNTLQLNAEAFLWKYKDQQVSFLGLDDCGGVAFITINAGQATIKGFNVDTTWQFTSRDSLRAALEYADSNYDSFRFQQFLPGAFVPSAQSRCSAAPAGGPAPIFNIDCTGQQLTRLPKLIGQLAYSHRFTLSNGTTITPALVGQGATSRWLDIGYGPNGHVGSYVVGDFDLAVRSASEQWSATLFLHNFTNEAYYTSGINCCGATPNGTRFYSAAIAAPKTFGIRAAFKF
jgi:iron complex outermembrane receptor protein